MRVLRLPYKKRVEWRGVNTREVECWHFPLVLFGFTLGTFTIEKGDC